MPVFKPAENLAWYLALTWYFHLQRTVQTLINSAGELARKWCWNSYAGCEAGRDETDSTFGLQVCVCVYIYLHNSTKGSTTSGLMVAKPPLDAVFNTKWVLSTPKGRLISLLLRPYPGVSVQFRWVQVCRQAPQGPDECCAVARCWGKGCVEARGAVACFSQGKKSHEYINWLQHMQILDFHRC